MEKTKQQADTTKAPLAAPARRRGRWKWVLALVLLAALGLASLYTWASLAFTYSSGDRAGYLQKFSRKGWLCKTWEGQIAMTTIPGTTPEIFSFTVRDEAVAAKLRQMSGQRIAIHYEQHKGVPNVCFGETEYFVVGAEPLRGP